MIDETLLDAEEKMEKAVSVAKEDFSGIRTGRARVLTVTAPGGFAGFVTAAGVPVTGDLPVSWEFDVGRIKQAAPAHGVEILGPPPTLPGLRA